MARTKLAEKSADHAAELLRVLLIVQLSLAGVGQREIRAIVGGNINYINKIVKLLRKKSSRTKKGK